MAVERRAPHTARRMDHPAPRMTLRLHLRDGKVLQVRGLSAAKAWMVQRDLERWLVGTRCVELTTASGRPRRIPSHQIERIEIVAGEGNAPS
jgi:hypothetical protein